MAGARERLQDAPDQPAIVHRLTQPERFVGDILQRLKGEVTYPNYLFTDDMGLARRSIARVAAFISGVSANWPRVA